MALRHTGDGEGGIQPERVRARGCAFHFPSHTFPLSDGAEPPTTFEIQDFYRGRWHLPVLREVEDSSDEDRFGSNTLLDESDLSALAEASMKLEELEQTVGRILSQVEREQELHDGSRASTGQRDDAYDSDDLDSNNSFDRLHHKRREDIDRYSRELDDQLSDLEQCARAYSDGVHALGRLSDGVEDLHRYSRNDSSEDVSYEERFGSQSDTLSENVEAGDMYSNDYYERDVPYCYDARYSHVMEEDYERYSASEYCNSNLDEKMTEDVHHYNEFGIPPGCNQSEIQNTKSFASCMNTFSHSEESYSDRLRRILIESSSEYQSPLRRVSHIPCFESNTMSYLSSWNNQQTPRSELYEATTQGPQSCSLEDLEKCIDKLVLDVEREEARLRRQVKDRLEARSSRFSMPMPPRPLSEVPPETMQGRASSMDSLFQPQQSHEIWWEGVYRNITRSPDGQEASLSEHSSSEEEHYSVLRSSLDFPALQDSDTDEDSSPSHGHIMLLVRTTDTGKETIEIRSMRQIDLDANNNSSTSEPSQRFSRSFAATSISSPVVTPPVGRTPVLTPTVVTPPDTPTLQRLFVHSPPSVRELRSFSLEDLCRPATGPVVNRSPCASTLPSRGRRLYGGSLDPFEFNPPPSLVQYVIPEALSAPSSTPRPIEYVTPPLPGPAPGRGYCTWLPHPSPRGRLDSSEALPPLSAASESKEVSSVEGTQTGSGDISSIGQPTQLSAVEETFTKSFITPAQPKEVAKSKEEKKKEKKEREKEEKEKKKKEKREKEQKEREEKERKDREKKEKKEREKKEKEEREKKDKEGKKTKYEKEKADKEKMEKESKDLQSGKDEHFQKTMSQRERFEDSSRMENATSSPEVVDEVCTKEVKLKPTIPTTITTVTLPKSKSVAESHKSTTEEGDASGNGEIDVTVSATVIDATTQNDDNSYNSRPLLNSQSLGTNSLIQCNEENTTESISQGTETFFKSEQPRPFEKATPDTTGVNQTEQAHSLVIACLEMCDQTDIALPTNVAIYSDKSGSVKEISDSRKKQEPDIKEKSFFVKSCLSEYVDEPISKSVDIECSVKSTDKRLECSAPHLYSASPDPKMQPVMTDKETVVIGVTESIKNDKPETALQSIVSETSFTNHKIIKDLHEPKELKVKTRTLTENSLIQEDYLDDNMGRERSVISSVGEEQSTLESANTPKKVVEKMKKSLNLSELQSIQPFLDGDLLNKTKKELPLGTIQSDASTPLKVEKNHSFDLQPSVAPPVSSDGLVEKTPDQTSVANISKTPNLQNDTKEKEQPLYDEDNIQKNTQTQQVTVVDPSVQLTLIDSSTQFADRDEKGNYLMSNIEQPTVSKKEDSRLSSAIPQVFNDVTTTCRETLRTSSESSGINSAIHSVDELNIQSAEGNINKGDSETRILSTASGSMKKEEDSDIESARLCKSKQELSKILKDVSLGKPDTIEELKEPILSIDGGNIPRFKCREQTSNLESITFTSPTIHEGLCTSDRDMKESSRKPEEFSKSGSSVDQILAPTPSLSEAQLSSELGKEMGSPKNVVTETVVMREYTFDGTPPDVRTLTTLSGHGMDLKSDNVPDQLRSTSDLPITSSRADDFKATVEKVSPVVKTVPTVTNPIICKGDDIPAHLVLENVDVPLQLNLTHRGVEESSPISVTSVVSHKTSFISEKPEDEAKTMVTHIKTKSDRESGKNELKLGLLDESSEDFSSSFLDDDFLQNAPKVSIVKTETKRVFTTAAGGTSMPLGDPEVLSSTVSYVTTPTMQRRAHSQRRSREERPAPVDVTYTQDDLSDSEDENYIVTEPLDETEKVEDRFRINSSPEILNVNPTRHESVRRSPDQNRVKFQLGSLDSQDSLSSDGVTPQTPGAKTHKFTVEKVNEEDGIPKSIARSGATNTDKNDRAESEERMEKKLRRVERHFERMASQSFAGESAPDERDTDFQRVVSQLSREEMAGSEDEYENLLIEATTPSDEWDSRADTDDTPEDRTAQSVRQFADGLGVGRDGSLVQPLPSCPLPSPRNLQLTPDKDDDDDPDSEPAIQEKIKSYSERRAFWEHVSSGSGETPTEPPTALFPQSTPVPVPRHLHHTESADSEAAYISHFGTTTGVENDAFAADYDDLSVRRKPKKTQSVEETYEVPPPVAVRKAMYERSISLPLTDFAENGKRKKQFEDQIKKEMVAENLLQQLEEEAIPEHKELPHRTTSDDHADSMPSDDTFETDVDSTRSSVKDIAHAFEKGWSLDSNISEKQVYEPFTTLGEESFKTAEAVFYKAEEHLITETEEEVEEWKVQDFEEISENLRNVQRPIPTNEDEKTVTEVRRESLAKTHGASSSKLAEVMQYKSDCISKPSDSLEVHVDKSETEDTEKSRDLDEDIKELENLRRTESRATSADSKGARGQGDHQSQSSSEDTQCESDVTPEDHPYQQEGHSLYQPQQNLQDTVWEVGIQEQAEPEAEEYVQDMLVDSSVILQNGDLDEHTKRKLVNGVASSVPITEEEARKVAEGLVKDIEQEVSKRQIEIPISDTLRQIAYEKNLEEREIQLMESLLAKKSKEHSHLFSRTDTTTSSMEITDEDLRSSGVEIDLSPTESQSGLYTCLDPRAQQEDEKPEALRSEDIDFNDLKPDPIQMEEHPSDRMKKNFSVIEESDECDTRSDPSEPKPDSISFSKKADSCQVVDSVKEELCFGQKEDTAIIDECISEAKSSPTGSTNSSCGKKTPPPKPERKSRDISSLHQRDQQEELISDFLINSIDRQNKQNEQMEEKLTVRAESIDSQRSSSQDDKSPLSGGEGGRMDHSDSSAVVRRHNVKTDVESSSSGEKNGSALLPDRRSGADFDPYSSSSESHYHSSEQSYSRPCSSDVEGLLAVTTGSSEYESAIASTRSVTSAEYQTAVSSLSSRESMKSLDSESSGHLASVEVSSEASETLVPSATELEHDDMDDSSFNIVVDDDIDKQLLEQYDKVPRRVHATSGTASISKISNEDISEDDKDDNRDLIETDEEDAVPHIMKRSHEMNFHPDTKAVSTGRSDSSSIDAPEDKLASSLDGDTGSVLSMSISSASETLAVKTVIELSRTDSDKMDASGTSELLTASATSQEMSFSSESKEEADASSACQIPPTTIESSTSTPTHQRDTSVTSVTLTTSTVDENGTQCSSTQVTSETTAELPKRSHRRNGSSSNFSSFIPQKPVSDFIGNKQSEEYLLSENAESESYCHDVPLSLKEEQDIEKKDIDERLEESYQTEVDQALHRDAREYRYVCEDVEIEYDQAEGSRPQSQVSKSDSESGNRAVSSGLSDDRPDSELAEVLVRDSSDATCEEIIERPLTPEPVDEVEIKDDTPEFSSEALASVTELELEYSHAFSRTVEYASHVSPIKEKPCVAWEHAGEYEEEMAEAEAAFHMVPHHSPHHSQHHHSLPETIIEDEDAEKHELETREAALKEEQRRREEHARSVSPGAIPDITVTQHLAPLIDRDFKYPDLDLEEQEAIATCTSLSSHESTTASETTTDTSQGKEYILDESIITQSEASTEIDRTSFELKTKKNEMDSMTESPTSESFEMLEKPEDLSDKMDIGEDFVIVEEVGREAHESDSEGQGVRISSRSIPIRKRDVSYDEDEDFIATSPPPPATRMMNVKYYGEGGMLEEEDDQFHFDGDHVRVDTIAYGETTAEHFEADAEAEVEASKKWIEMQFKGEEPAPVTTAYSYEMEFERGPLEDIKEEDEMASSSKIGSLGSQKESVGSFGSVKESLSSTPEYDVLAGKKYFTRSGDNDDISMSSLQEFESLEQQVCLDAVHRKMVSSQDSLNGTAKKKGHGDDISLASLQEFEKMERACFEADRIEMKARVEEALLSEIDEGHESQVSESDETISGPGMKTIGDSDSEDYDKRMFEIDEIIRQAQSNVERFEEPVHGSKSGGPESFGRGDSLEEVARVPDLELDMPPSMVTSTDSLELRSRHADSMVTSADSLEVKVSPGHAMTTSADSIELQQQLRVPVKGDIMTDSIELPSDQGHLVTSSDSLELETTLERVAGDMFEEEDASLAGRGSIRSCTSSLHDRSSSSGREGDLSFSSGKGACGGVRLDPLMMGSTDSLEPSSSTATYATYQYETDSIMSSSFTSGGSNTMVSSTETLEASASLQPESVWYEEPFPEGASFVTESIEHSDDPEFSHIIKRTVHSAPTLRKVTFRGPGADAALRDYVEKFSPGKDTVETQEVDSDGNVHISRIVQQRVMVHGGELTRTDLTGPQLGDYIRRQGMTETDDILASSQPGAPGAVVATTQQRLTTSHLTGEAAPSAAPSAAPLPAPRRPPPSHDISVDDEPEYDVREHDWRFNLQHSAEEAPEEEDAAQEKE